MSRVPRREQDEQLPEPGVLCATVDIAYTEKPRRIFQESCANLGRPSGARRFWQGPCWSSSSIELCRVNVQEALAASLARIPRLQPDLVPVYRGFLEPGLSGEVHQASRLPASGFPVAFRERCRYECAVRNHKNY
jgi:hypothetical protein